MYSLAGIYRDFILASYGKKMTLNIFNNIGPPLGTKASLIIPGNDYKVRGSTLNSYYSDNYLLVEKYMYYATEQATSTGQWESSGDDIRTILVYKSNNLGVGIENISNMVEFLTRDGGT